MARGRSQEDGGDELRLWSFGGSGERRQPPVPGQKITDVERPALGDQIVQQQGLARGLPPRQS